MKLRAAVAAGMLAAPTVALAGDYVALAIDRSAMSIVDLRSPRLTGENAETYEVVLNRAPARAKRGKVADYTINRIDFDCAKGKVRRFYTASYSLAGALAASDPKPMAWKPVVSGSKEDSLRNLGCRGALPRAVFTLGDVRVGPVLTSYRSGAYDRYIR